MVFVRCFPLSVLINNLQKAYIFRSASHQSQPPLLRGSSEVGPRLDSHVPVNDKQLSLPVNTSYDDQEAVLTPPVRAHQLFISFQYGKQLQLT